MKNSNHVGKLFVLPFVTFLNFIMLLYISFCNLFIGLRHKKIKKYREGYESVLRQDIPSKKQKNLSGEEKKGMRSGQA